MADIGVAFTNSEARKLNKRIEEVYKEAERDLQAKFQDFNERYAAKNNILLQKLKNGEITQKDYENWLGGQVFQSKQWQSKINQASKTLNRSNKIAVDMINGSMSNVFSFNGNYAAYEMERGAGVNFGFDLYDQTTVTNLIKNDPQILPKWKIDEPKSYIWNKKKVNNAILRGIIQGERLDQITKRLSTGLVAQNENLMKTFARTGMTQAQNAGRYQRQMEAKGKGIKVYKEWMATLDARTRDSHQSLDGEKREVGDNFKFSNGCRYPGDPEGPPHEVYNCRCTLVSDVADYPAIFSRRDNVTGQVVNKLGPDTVENLTYRDWKMIKGITQTAKMIDAKDLVTKTLEEVVGMGSGHLEGLPFKYKGFDSAFRKVVGDTKEEIERILSEEGRVITDRSEIMRLRTQFANKTTDALRFTNISPNDNLVDDYNTIISELEKRGFRTIRVKNTLGDKEAAYRGINTLVQTPSGYVIEMQYHTPQSLEIKEINHKMYEEVRKLDKNDPRVAALNKEMADNCAKIVSPRGIGTIKTVKYDTSQVKNVSPYGKYW